MADNREQILERLIKAQERYQKLLDMQEKSGNDYSASLEQQNERVKKLGNQLKELNKSNQKFVGDLERGLSSIGSAFSNFQNSQRQVVINAKSLNDISSYQQELVETILEDSRSLAELNSSDTQQILTKVESLEKQLSIAQAIFGVDSDITQALMAQKDEAIRIAQLSEEERKVLELQAEAAEKIKQTMQGISETIQTAVSNLFSFRGAMGGILVAAGSVMKNFTEVNKQLGQVGDYTDGAAFNASLMSFAFDDAAGTLKALSAEMGGTEDATFGAQLQTNLMANNLGISNTEAVSLSGSLARLNDGSLETAGNLAAGAREFARMNNIPVSQLMGDVAGSAEEFALFGKDGGKNILQAAGYAAKLGTNMGTISGIAENLLDFENSITKELELGAMLGRNINLDKARQLAYQGDIEGATKATLDELGGIAAFNKMDYFQKKQTADLLGVSVAELQKMATNQEKAANISQLMNGDFSNMGESLKAIAAEFGPKVLDWSGKFLMLSSQAGQTWTAFGGTLKDIGGKIGGMFTKGAGAATSAASTVTDKVGDSISGKITEGGGPDLGKKGGLMDSMSKINMNAVLKGAAALVVVAGAVFVFGKAVQEFMKVSWEAVGMAVVSMLALVGAVALLGAIMSSGVGAVAILAGAAAMLVIAASVLVLGNALQAIGTGFEMMANGIGTLMPQLMSVATTIGGLVTLIPSIALLAYSIMGLSGSLVALGVAGVLAAPGLMALGAVGTVTEGLNSLFGGGEEGGAGGDSDLLNEIRGLREDLNNGKVAVYLDGQKVTAGVSRVVSRVGSNSYAT